MMCILLLDWFVAPLIVYFVFRFLPVHHFVSDYLIAQENHGIENQSPFASGTATGYCHARPNVGNENQRTQKATVAFARCPRNAPTHRRIGLGKPRALRLLGGPLADQFPPVPLEHWLRGKRFDDIEQMRQSLSEFFDFHYRHWDARGNTQLPSRWQKLRFLLVTCAFVDLLITVCVYKLDSYSCLNSNWCGCLWPLPFLLVILIAHPSSLPLLLVIFASRLLVWFAVAPAIPYLARPLLTYTAALVGLGMSQTAAVAPITTATRDRPPRTPQEMRKHRSSIDAAMGNGPRVCFDRSISQSQLGNRGGQPLSEQDVQRHVLQAMQRRRTSLPVSSHNFLLNRTTSNVSEARGLVADMLANRDLPPNVATCLRAVASLLNPQPPTINLHMDMGLPRVVENPYSGEQLVVGGASKPRVSNITFSTVTSATGLPTIAAEPSRPRSSSYWKPHEKQEQPLPTPQSQSSTTTTGASADSDAHACAHHNHARHAHAVPVLASAGMANHIDHHHHHGHHHYPAQKAPSLKSPSPGPISISPSVDVVVAAPPSADSDDASDTSSRSSLDLADAVVQTDDGVVFEPRLLDADPSLSRISEWSFPIFEVAERHQCTILTRMTYTIFKQAEMFRIFRISPQKFFNFFHALERGYWDIPYHNRVHAADVLHGCHYLTCHPVRAFLGAPSSPDSPLPPSMPTSLPIADSMSPLEGVENDVIMTQAILYNDRSVLENHHAAESWKLLCQPQNHFIESLDAAEIKRFRYLVLEYILATDLKQHFDIIMQFNEKASEMDLTSESDRVLVAQMLIKFADINSPSKPYALHRQWTDRICEEFFEQGDEEKRRGMSVSPYMDRKDPQVAKLQDSFIAHIVSPLAMALNEIGLLPILPGLADPEIIINLKHNHQKWLAELDVDSSAATSSTSGHVTAATNDMIEEETNLSSPGSPAANSEPVSKQSTPARTVLMHPHADDPTAAQRRSPSVDSVVGVEDAFEMCTIHENEEFEEAYL